MKEARFRAVLGLACLVMLLGCATPETDAPRHSNLDARGRLVNVRNPRLTVAAPSGFQLTGPHRFTKVEDNGYHFEVSLVSYVSTNEVVSVAAERLVEENSLNYDDLSPADWPNKNFLQRASGCAAMTSSQAAQMPPESGMSWILQAGFNPNGSFVYEGSLLLAPDRRHETTIELIAPVASCDDANAVAAALASLRGRVRVTTTLP